jgi:type VI protein secretion system component VasF
VGDTNDFEHIEHELREQLAPRPAPHGLATRVLARIDERERTAAVRMPPWRWIAAAAVLIAAAALTGGQWEIHRQQQIEGERARDQVILALHIAGSTLQAVQQKVQNAGNTGKDTPQ